MMKKKLRKIRGMLVLEPALLILIFIFSFVLINNGIITVLYQEYSNSAETAALAGAGVLLQERGSATASSDSVAEALTFATMYYGMEGAIQSSQVTITLGTWASCQFTAGTSSPNAIRVDIAPPLGTSGQPIGLTRMFGRINLPFFQRIPSAVTAVGSYDQNTVVLVEYEGKSCLN